MHLTANHMSVQVDSNVAPLEVDRKLTADGYSRKYSRIPTVPSVLVNFVQSQPTPKDFRSVGFRFRNIFNFFKFFVCVCRVVLRHFVDAPLFSEVTREIQRSLEPN